MGESFQVVKRHCRCQHPLFVTSLHASTLIMPPTTRRSQAGASQASIAKNPTRKRGPQATTSLRKESSSLWNFNTTSNGDEVLPSTEDQADDEDQNEEHPSLALGGSADALDSLHEMADKVGREVELFS